MRELQCPACGANLKFRNGMDTAICKYCGNQVIIPDNLRGGGKQFTGTGQRVANKGLLIVVALAVAILLGTGAMVFFLASTGTSAVTNTGKVSVSTGESRTGPSLEFGGEGIGPGRFQDPRTIAVDSDGHIYVGEFSSGRIQIFDDRGAFITQWIIPGDDSIYLGGMASTRDGVLYLVYDGRLWIHDGMTGEVIGALDHPDGFGFEDVAAAPDGRIVAVWSKFSDDIICFDSEGMVDLLLREAISSQSGDSELDMSIAVDGEGNIYVLGSFNAAVFKFNSEGGFINRFGSDGNAAGCFTSPGAITTDALGRILISDTGGIMVFDDNGMYLETIPADGFVFGITVDDANRLYAVSSCNSVFVYDLDVVL